MVATQLKIFMPVGTQHAGSGEYCEEIPAQSNREHMVYPHPVAQKSDRHRGRRHERIAEDRLARKHGNDLGDHSERGKHHDVDLGMPENPEVVLPQQWRAALHGIEELAI
jgi:hypothetical protein